jgi:hypothetical protein
MRIAALAFRSSSAGGGFPDLYSPALLLVLGGQIVRDCFCVVRLQKYVCTAVLPRFVVDGARSWLAVWYLSAGGFLAPIFNSIQPLFDTLLVPQNYSHSLGRRYHRFAWLLHVAT